MRSRVDLAIVGSGFGGSLIARIARRLGLTVALLERSRHPRFAIGESSTPLANMLLEELATRYDLAELKPFCKWGPWRRERPQVDCGLKRGFTFYHHISGERWARQADRSNELLVAASPCDEIADTHWYRPEFDQALARMAVDAGAELYEEAQLQSLAASPDGIQVEAQRPNGSLTLQARFLIDASGPRGFVARQLGVPERPFPGFPRTQSLFGHFEGVERWESLFPIPEGECAPYPCDDAAMHHVFAGGWMWVLRFSRGITSAGIAATDTLAQDLGWGAGGWGGAEAWSRFLERFPAIRDQFARARPVLDFQDQPRLSYCAATMAGPGWVLLPSAAGFVDPLLSTGFPLTLFGIERLARMLEEDWGTPRWFPSLAAYEQVSFQELNRAAELVTALYRHLDDFAAFSALTLVYFASASFAETARRLNQGKPDFLSHLDSIPALRACLRARPGTSGPALADQIRAAIEPINVAGLADPRRRNWYPARAEDLYAAASKLRVEPTAIAAMLERVGFVPR
jgi:FADH2 O2-dependent halogenase